MFMNEDESKMIVAPSAGRLVMFTSGRENLHYVEQVTSGVRFALTTAFACSEKHSSEDQIFDNLKRLHKFAD